MSYIKLDVSEIMAKYRYTEAEAKAFMWGVKQSGAPEMYKALRKVRANIGHIIMTKADAILVDQIDAALAKAEGK